MRILIVKLSSLGDVVHTMPAVQDLRRAFPTARIEWVVEKGFAPLVERCAAVNRVVTCELRRWARAPLSRETRTEWRAFRKVLRDEPFDAVIDLQGLTKSALIARAARLSSHGRRFAMANRTDGAGYEAPTRWVADIAIRLDPHVHAVQRAREICSRSMGYEVPAALDYALRASPSPEVGPRTICFVHGTSRDDKCWPEANWIALGRRLIEEGARVALPHGSDAERERSDRIAAALGANATSWPRMPLSQLTDRMAACAGVIGVDSGLSHIAVALDLPHVQIYNFETAWRTGPVGAAHQVAVYDSPTPSLDAVWRAWERTRAAR